MKNEQIENLIKGLQIIQKYSPEGVGGDPDAIHIFPTKKAMTKADIAKLEELGFTQDGSYDKNENWIFYT